MIERMDMKGLDPLEILQVNKNVGFSHFAIQALVSVTPGRVNEGPLTNWTREEMALLSYLGNPVDSYSLKVQNVWEAGSLRGDASELRVFFRKLAGALLA